jgi:hypothetical protein
VYDLLLSLKSSEKSLCIRPLQLAEVAAAFVDASHSSLECLQSFIKTQGNDLSCFEDIRSFVELLEPLETVQLITNTMPELAASLDTAIAKLLALKIRYMAASRSTASKTCTICGGVVRRGCKACLAKISQAANELHQSLALDSEAQRDILPELSMLIAHCRITPCNLKARSPATLREPLQTLISLEVQHAKSPKHLQLSLLIVQLHTLLGSAHRAREVLGTIDDDSFSVFFLDRISTIAPSIITDSRDLLHQLRSSESLAKRQFVDALRAGDHSDVLRLHKRIESSTSKSISVVTLIEEARASGMLGNPHSVLQDARHGASMLIRLPRVKDTNVIQWRTMCNWQPSTPAFRLGSLAHLRTFTPVYGLGILRQ